MASIYKRGSIWWIHYLVEGRSVSRSLKTTNKRIAQDIKKNLEALEVTGQLPRPSKTPVGPLLQAYCEYLARTQTSQGARKDRSYLRACFGPCCPALEPDLPVPHKYRKPDDPVRKAKDPLVKRHVRVRTLEQVTPAVIASFVRTRVVHDGLSASRSCSNGTRHRPVTVSCHGLGPVEARRGGPVRRGRVSSRDAPGQPGVCDGAAVSPKGRGRRPSATRKSARRSVDFESHPLYDGRRLRGVRGLPSDSHAAGVKEPSEPMPDLHALRLLRDAVVAALVVLVFVVCPAPADASTCITAGASRDPCGSITTSSRTWTATSSG